MRYKISSTTVFDKWLSKIKDRQAVKAVLLRLARVEAGNFGDAKPVGDNVSELRIFVGKGYRVYFTVEGEKIVVLLCGGTKSNKKEQQDDIKQAKSILAELEARP
jgi:putative addiction module killer protein